MVIIIILIFYTYIIIRDLIPKFKNKSKKEAIIYSVSVVISFVILILESLDIDVPGPTNVIKDIIKTFK